MSKILEKFEHDELYRLLHNKINQNQHGFVKHRSTLINLLRFSSYLQYQMYKCIQVDAVYIDFKKTFDKVDH